MAKFYNKLVRDKIPNVIVKDGNKICVIERLTDEEVMKYLYDKLLEEANEVIQDKNIEELADVLEIVFAIANKYGYTEEDVLEVMDKKRDERGGFEGNIVLKAVFDDED
jgi:predicted house-cleaning noncanonical NTP pyrophosphatase (MazG superfamily)